MDSYSLFIDGSFDPQQKVGFGAYLLVFDGQSVHLDLAERVRINKFDNTSSVKLELQTLLWALDDIAYKSKHLNIYTDSQNILQLPQRRKRLEEKNYISNQGKVLPHRELYQTFFHKMDQLNGTIYKVKGHLPKSQKEEIDKFFTFVDKASRKALRAFNQTK